MKPTTVLDLRKKADSERIVMVTAYDATMARWVDASGADMILVGDSLGMVVQGHQDTLCVTLEHMVYHTRCVGRGVSRAHVVADLPFMSYQVSDDDALRSAGRLVQEGRAHSVKLEGGERVAGSIRRIVDAGIPVLGHVGLTPQSVHAFGGFKVQGRDADGARSVVRDALAVEQSGAYGVVLEGIPAELGAEITDRLGIPTIGIGAGSHCNGQVLVCNDVLGMDSSFAPRFVRRYASIEQQAIEALARFGADVRGGAFPAPSESFRRNRPASVADVS